jgi:hypothetical protein
MMVDGKLSIERQILELVFGAWIRQLLWESLMKLKGMKKDLVLKVQQAGFTKKRIRQIEKGSESWLVVNARGRVTPVAQLEGDPQPATRHCRETHQGGKRGWKGSKPVLSRTDGLHTTRHPP